MVLPTLNQVHRPSQLLTEAFLRHERNAVPYDVVGSSRQLVGQRVMRHHPVRLLRLAVIIGPRILVISPGDLRSLREGPGKVLVAALLVAFAFLFFVADPLGRDLPTIGYIVADFREPADRPGFQHNREPQDLSDAGFGQKTIVGNNLGSGPYC